MFKVSNFFQNKNEQSGRVGLTSKLQAPENKV